MYGTKTRGGRRWAAMLGFLAMAACTDGGALPDARGVARVEVTPGTRTLRAGEVYRLRATLRDRDGAALDGAVEWASSDESVASVDAGGNVAARAAGAAVITASGGGRTGRASVTVEAPSIATVEITPASPLVVGVGEARPLAAVARAADGAVLGGRGVVWASGDTTIAGVTAAGVVEGRAEGEVVVTARVEGTIAFLAVRVDGSRSPGDTMRMHAIVRGVGGRALERAVEWRSGDPAIAAIDPAGRLTALAEGTVRITASADGKMGYVDVRVARWAVRALSGVGGGALPGLLFEHADGTSRLVVHDGVLRSISSVGAEHFEMRLGVWLQPSAGPATQAVYETRGTLIRNLGNTTAIFYTDAGDSFTGAVRPDGALVVKRRFPGSAAETTLVFAAP